ncbi:unnamed protein product [Rotaria magnacalcarata]|uniref:Uncharacterized protein n=1 Tax=Rotaria magnacalcarata TaxID=392030 RepID=A0A8S3FKX5_9BILA|nr:unnamed protein product [Rotaria magnacalcarata]
MSYRGSAKVTLVPIARTGRYIVLPEVCDIHASSMSVREEARLSMAPPRSSPFLQQQRNFTYLIPKNKIKLITIFMF